MFSFLGLAKDPIDTFAAQMIRQLPEFKTNVEKNESDDWNREQQMVGFNYFIEWTLPEKQLSATLRWDNHKIIVYPFDTTNPANFTSNKGYYYFKKVIYRNLNIRGLTESLYKKINDAMNTVPYQLTIWEPVDLAQYKGVINLVSVYALKGESDCKQLSDFMKKFCAAADEVQLLVKKILDGANSTALEEDKSEQLTLQSKAPENCPDTPKLIYNNQSSFAKAVAERVQSWSKEAIAKCATDYPVVTSFHAYLLYAKNIYGPNKANLEAKWTGTAPNQVTALVNIYESMVCSLLEEPSDPINTLGYEFPALLKAINDKVLGILDGVEVISSMEPGVPDTPLWFWWGFRNINLDSNPRLEELLEKIAAGVFSLFVKLDPSKFTSDLKRKKIEEKSLLKAEPKAAAVVNSIDQKWLETAKEFLEAFRSYFSIIKENNLESIPQGWNRVDFNFNYIVDGLTLIASPAYYFESPPPAWFEGGIIVKMPLTELINLGRMTEEERVRLNDYIVGMSNSQNLLDMIFLQPENASMDPSTHTLDNVIFTARKTLVNFDTKDIQDSLARALEDFARRAQHIKKELEAHLPKQESKESQAVPCSVQMQEISNTLSSKSAESLIALKNQFNSLFQLNPKQICSFTLVGSYHKNTLSPIYVKYALGENSYLFQNNMLSSIPFLTLNKQIEQNYRKQCNNALAPVRLIFSDFSYSLALAVEKLIPADLSEDKLCEELNSLALSSQVIYDSIF